MKFTLFMVFMSSLRWMKAVYGDGRLITCCLTVSNTIIPAENIVSYTIQDQPLCPIRAIRFRTKKNKTICSDPSSRLAKHIFRGPSAEMYVHPKIISVLISTTATTIKTPGPETETSTSEIKSISRTIIADKAISDVDGRSSFNAIKVQITKDPENSWTTPIPDVDTRRITTEAKITESTQSSVTTFKKSGLDVAIYAVKECCLTVTKHKPAFHEIVDYRAQETPLCSVRAVLFITVENNRICSSPVEDWVQDYIRNLNIRRNTTEKTDKREFAITRIKPLEQDRRRSIETIETFHLDAFSKVEKKQMESLETSVALSSEINDPYKNTKNYLCLKKEQSKYFCIKQP